MKNKFNSSVLMRASYNGLAKHSHVSECWQPGERSGRTGGTAIGQVFCQRTPDRMSGHGELVLVKATPGSMKSGEVFGARGTLLELPGDCRWTIASCVMQTRWPCMTSLSGTRTAD